MGESAAAPKATNGLTPATPLTDTRAVPPRGAGVVARGVGGADDGVERPARGRRPGQVRVAVGERVVRGLRLVAAGEQVPVPVVESHEGVEVAGGADVLQRERQLAAERAGQR